MKKLFLLGLLTGLSGEGLPAQVALINDDFEAADPCESGDWVSYDDLRWVPPGVDPCDRSIEPDHSAQSPMDPQCNLFTPGEGYVLLTADYGNQGGSLFRVDPIRYEDFKLTAEIELRGGHPKTRPADGMCIVIQGDAGNGPPAGTGTRGGGLGAPGLADREGPMLTPSMIFEFDNCNQNGSDNPGPKTLIKSADDNHVAFHYSPNGFRAIDDFQKNDEPGTPSNDAITHIAPKLNGVEKGLESGKWLFEVFVQDGIVACNLTNLSVGFPKTRMYTYTIPGFLPFYGFLGLTASTGGADQNHILHSIKVESLPSCNAPFHRGDADHDGQLRLADAVRILGYLFLGETAPACLDAADADGNNRLQVTDAVRILGYLFLGQAPPPSPGPPPGACGQDNDTTHLGCATYDKC
jgi:hypothetical protein